MASAKTQSAISQTRSMPEKQSSTASTAISIMNWEVSQSTSLDSNMFNTLKVNTSSVEPEQAVTSPYLKQDNSKSVEYASENPISLKMSNMFEMSSSAPLRRLLQPKAGIRARAGLVNKLVSQVLRSFPERNMNEGSCPPFIHPSIFHRRMNSIHSDDPIVICKEISQKFMASKAVDDFSIWDAIASEQARIYDQRASFDKWLHLSSAQAMTMYLLMLTTECEKVLTHHPTLPITMLYTLGAIFQHLNEIHPGYVAEQERIGSRPTWEDWIFAESKLRTGTVYFMVALLFDVDFGIPCDRETDSTFEDIELPAAKQLWEAKTEISWNEELDLAASRGDGSAAVCANESRLKYGDLVRLNKQDGGYESPLAIENKSRLAERIEKWHKGMDEFGMLVALCGTMA